jgi:hypothetical protein
MQGRYRTRIGAWTVAGVLNERETSMGAKKRQTFGKMQRERDRAEKRARKQEKKDEKKAIAIAAAEAGLTVEEFILRTRPPEEHPAEEEVTPAPTS